LNGFVAIATAVVIAAILCGLLVILPAAGRGTIRAGLLLVLWYGLRGLAAGLLSRGRSRAMVVEYLVFVAGAAAAIAAGVWRGWGA
jgi:hypothetical protein